jgi:hypothetical protein
LKFYRYIYIVVNTEKHESTKARKKQMSSTNESLRDLLLSLLAIIIMIIIIVLPTGIHTSGKGENLLECQKPDSSEIPGEVIGIVAFIKGKETKYATIKKTVIITR